MLRRSTLPVDELCMAILICSKLIRKVSCQSLPKLLNELSSWCPFILYFTTL